MKNLTISRFVGFVALSASVTCAAPTAPELIDVPSNMESITLTVGSVRPVGNPPEPPTVTFEGVAGGIRFGVTRSWLCAMVATAGYRVQSTGVSTMTIVASVGAHPAALCAAVVAEQDYSGTVPATPSRTYEVRFYEQVGDGKARLLRTKLITAR